MTNTRRAGLVLLRPALAISLAVAAAYSVAAQKTLPTPPCATPADVAISSATAKQVENASKVITGWEVSVAFSADFTAPGDSQPATKAANYFILNVDTGTQIPVSDASLIVVSGLTNSKVKLLVPSADALNMDENFYVFARNLQFNGSCTESIPSHQIKFHVDPVITQKPAIDTTPAAPRATWGLKPSKGKNDSDLYATYELTRVRGAATTGTGELKVAIPFFADFWDRTSKFSPLFELNASSDASADPDSLKFAFEWFLPVHVGHNREAKFPYTSVDLINTGKIEAPKNFNNINALWESKWLFPSAQIPGSGKPFRMFLDPYVGSELGKNLRSPLPAAEGHALARLMAGADLTVQVPIKNLNALKQLEFTTSYIRRWPLKRELNVKTDDSGNSTLLTLSKGPKDYVDSKFTVKVNDFFGPYVGYEWGRQPPNYKLVDHKWTFGLIFKSKVRAK